MDQMYKELNQSCVKLVSGFMNLEKMALLSSEFNDISMNDVHIMDAVGMDESRNMSTIAHKLNVTVGSLTTAMNGLVRKGYVQRERSEMDRRVVYIRLTEKGQKVFVRHSQYHMRQMKSLTEHMTEEELKSALKYLHQAEGVLESMR